CRVAGVSTSGFYDWHARRSAGPSEAQLAEAELVAEIRAIHARSRGAYGCPRVVGKLHKQGRQVNHKRVERLMAKHGIKGRCGRRRVRTTIRDPHACPATDLVNRRFDRDRLNELWLGDITYIPTGEGWLYMSSVLDACSRRLLGWSLAGHMRTELVTDALEAAVGQPGAAATSAASCSTATTAARAESMGRRNTSMMEVSVMTMRERQRAVQLYRG